MDITVVATTVGYTPSFVGFRVYSSNLSLPAGGINNSPTSTVTSATLLGEKLDIAAAYSFGTAVIFSGDSIIKEAVLLSLLNSAPPPVGPAPPPPLYGSIAGSITQDGNDFSLSLNLGPTNQTA